MTKRLKEIEERLSAIKLELDGENPDINALEEETESLINERKALVEKAEKRQNIIKSIVDGTETRTIIKGFDNDKKPEERKYDFASPEYRTAWLKNIARDENGIALFGEMNAEERAAFKFTTENSSALIPKDTLNKIIELVESQSPILNDASHSQFARGFGIPRHLSIVSGDAAETDEGVAGEDEEDSFDTLSLDGVEIRKHCTLTQKTEFQSIDGFESWLIKHISDRIRVAKEKRVLSQLATKEYGIAEENKISGTLSGAEMRRIFSLIKGDGVKCVYANANMIWNVIASLVGKDGKELFIPNHMEDPIVAGTIYGAKVKLNDNLADGKLLAGIPKKILCNDFCALKIVPQIETKTLNRIFTGYACFDAGLENPKSFVEYTHEGEA